MCVTSKIYSLVSKDIGSLLLLHFAYSMYHTLSISFAIKIVHFFTSEHNKWVLVMYSNASEIGMTSQSFGN